MKPINKPQTVDISQDPGLSAVRKAEVQTILNDLGTSNPSTVEQVTRVINNIFTFTTAPNATSSNGQVTYNEGGILVGDAGLKYNANTDTLTTGSLNVTNIYANGVVNLGSVGNVSLYGGGAGEMLISRGSGELAWSNVIPNIRYQQGKLLFTDGNTISWTTDTYSNLATKTYVADTVRDIVGNAPAALNTLVELADALGNTGNYTVSIVNQLANKLDRDELENTLALSNIPLGRIPFGNNSTKFDSTANLFWDKNSKFLGINVERPLAPLDVSIGSNSIGTSIRFGANLTRYGGLGVDPINKLVTFYNNDPYVGGFQWKAGANGSTEIMRITRNNAISFGVTGNNYGQVGQVLQSNGDRTPQWTTYKLPLSDGEQGQVLATYGNGVLYWTTIKQLPDSDGTAGQFLQTDGNGNTNWNNVRSLPDPLVVTDGSVLVATGGSAAWNTIPVLPDTANIGIGNVLTVNLSGQITWSSGNIVLQQSIETTPPTQFQRALANLANVGTTGQVLAVDNNGNIVWKTLI